MDGIRKEVRPQNASPQNNTKNDYLIGQLIDFMGGQYSFKDTPGENLFNFLRDHPEWEPTRQPCYLEGINLQKDPAFKHIVFNEIEGIKVWVTEKFQAYCTNNVIRFWPQKDNSKQASLSRRSEYEDLDQYDSQNPHIDTTLVELESVNQLMNNIDSRDGSLDTMTNKESQPLQDITHKSVSKVQLDIAQVSMTDEAAVPNALPSSMFEVHPFIGIKDTPELREVVASKNIGTALQNEALRKMESIGSQHLVQLPLTIDACPQSVKLVIDAQCQTLNFFSPEKKEAWLNQELKNDALSVTAKTYFSNKLAILRQTGQLIDSKEGVEACVPTPRSDPSNQAS